MPGNYSGTNKRGNLGRKWELKRKKRAKKNPHISVRVF